MEDKNFDSLKNLKAPESWIENALNIPKAQEKKPIFFIRYSRQLMAVACLVLVCTVSLFVVLNKGDEPVLVVDPNPSETQAKPNDVANNDSNDSSDTKKDDKENENKKPHSIIESIIENLNGGAPHEGTEHSEKPTQSQNGDSQKPTEKPAVGPAQPTDGGVNPTDTPENTTPQIKPTAPHTPPATQAPPSEKPSVPTVPDNPSYPDLPGGAPATPPQDADFSVVVDKYFLTSSETLYCAVIAPDGSTLVADVPAELYPYGNSAVACLTLPKNQLTQSGQYTCFYYTFDYYVCTTYVYIG